MTRLSKIRKLMENHDYESILVMNPYNLNYASNFTGTSGFALIGLDQAYFITDSRYTEQASHQAKDYTIINHQGQPYETLSQLAEENQLDFIGLEEDFITVSQWDEIKDETECDLVDSSGLIELLREEKEEIEIEKIKEAIHITEEAFLHILSYIKPGMTEIQVANELDFYMRKLGASGLSFDTIVASGHRSAMPHGVASSKVIENNELVTIDFGCYYEGYVSDMTRTFAIGSVDSELKDIYEIVKQAHQKVTDQAGPKMTGADLDAVARDHITQAGYGKCFGHSTGHGIGLEIHETPNVSSRNHEYFKPYNVITNEPGIYLPGKGGVRIENDLLITETGCQDLMSVSIDFIEL